MKVYLLVFLVMLLIQLIPVHSEEEKKKKCFFTFFPLFLYGALRTDYGLDYVVYENLFEDVHQWRVLGPEISNSERGYLLLNLIFPSWRLLLLFTTAFVCFSWGVSFYKNIPLKWWGVAIFLLFLAGDKTIFFMYSGIRNAIAISIMLLSLSLVRDRKWLPYFVLTFLAMQFHTSAALFMPIAFLVGFDKPMGKTEAILWIGIMFFLIVVSVESVFDTATGFINNYFNRYEKYTAIVNDMGDTRSLIVKLSAAFFVIGMVWFMRSAELNENENYICRLSLICFMSPLLGALNIRMTQCFILFALFGVIIMINRWKNKKYAYLYLSFLMLYLGYAFFVVFLSENYLIFQTYHSIIGSL